MTRLYAQEEAEAAACLWLVSLATGLTASEILGAKKCPDACGIDRDRWELASNEDGPFYRCHVCKRFIGYVKEETKRQPRGRRKSAARGRKR